MTGSLPKQVTFAVEAEKVRSYLLNVRHPVGGSKARFFIGWGFSVERSTDVVEALLAHAAPSRLSDVVLFEWGTKYVFEGPLSASYGRTPIVRSVWTVRPDTTVGLLSSAYPV